MARCLFVLPTTFEMRDLPAGLVKLQVVLFPRMAPMTNVFAEEVADPSPVQFTTNRFTRMGSTYAGMPVFCAEGFEIREVYSDQVLSTIEYFEVWKANDKNLFNTMRNEAFKHAVRTDPDAREVDWSMEELFAPHQDLKHLVQRRVRLLVAIRTGRV